MCGTVDGQVRSDRYAKGFSCPVQYDGRSGILHEEPCQGRFNAEVELF